MKHNKPNFNRHLRVGEEIRHALSSLLMRGEVHEFASTVPVTVSEVRVSPDLRHATAFVLPLGGKDKANVLKALREATAAFRYALAQEVELQFMPQIRFELDESFDQADKISKILKADEKKRKPETKVDE